MAFSLLGNLCAGALALALPFAAAAQNAGRASEELVLRSESLTLDRQTNLIQARAPVIEQGTMRIVADEALATATEFEEAGEFRLTGNVSITVENAVLEADSAIFTFSRRRLSRGELVGSPATFRGVDAERKTTINGRARKISYDYVARTLRMTDDAVVQLDNREILGCDLIYDFMAERVTSGSSNCAYRVRILPEPGDQTSPPATPQ
jgi:lipopolysaccharide transport protein LptA